MNVVKRVRHSYFHNRASVVCLAIIHGSWVERGKIRGDSGSYLQVMTNCCKTCGRVSYNLFEKSTLELIGQVVSSQYRQYTMQVVYHGCFRMYWYVHIYDWQVLQPHRPEQEYYSSLQQRKYY